MSQSARRSQFTRSGGGGQRSTPFNVPAIVSEIVTGLEAPPTGPERFKLSQDDIAKYDHMRVITSADIYDNYGRVQVPAGSEAVVLLYPKGEGRTLDSLQNPEGNQPYVDLGDTVNLSRCFVNVEKAPEGSDAPAFVKIVAGRVNAGLSQVNMYQPIDAAKYFALSDDERYNQDHPDAQFYAKGGAFAGMLLVSHAGKTQNNDKEFQNVLVVNDGAAIAAPDIETVKAVLRSQRDNEFSAVGDNGVNVILYKKDGNPEDMGNRIAASFFVTSRKNEDGSYTELTEDEIFDNIRNNTAEKGPMAHQREVVSLMDSGEWDIVAMPAKRFSMAKSMLPGNEKNKTGDYSKLFGTIDPEAKKLDLENIGFRRGFVLATCPVVALDDKGDVRKDVSPQGEIMARGRGGAETPTGKAAENLIVGRASAWSVELFDNNPFESLEVTKMVGDVYLSKPNNSSPEGIKKALSEASSEAIRKFGGIGSSHRPNESPAATFDADIITAATPEAYSTAIRAYHKEERAAYSAALEELKARFPSQENEHKQDAPSP